MGHRFSLARKGRTQTEGVLERTKRAIQTKGKASGENYVTERTPS
jgi:hypothetical protein